MSAIYDFRQHGVLSKDVDFECYVCGCRFSIPRKSCSCEDVDGMISWKEYCPDCNACLSTKPDTVEHLRNFSYAGSQLSLEGYTDDGK